MNNRKRLICTGSTVKKLSVQFNCGVSTVYNALSYQKESELTYEIRKAAILMGAVLYDGTQRESINVAKNIQA